MIKDTLNSTRANVPSEGAPNPSPEGLSDSTNALDERPVLTGIPVHQAKGLDKATLTDTLQNHSRKEKLCN